MGQLTLVLGGVRSGKSRHAEALAARSPPVTYLATAQAGDDEMARRIAVHRQRRQRDNASWRTVEEPWEIAVALAAHGSAGCTLIECATLWLSNLLGGLPGRPPCSDEEILAEVDKLVVAVRDVAGRVIVVSNETGCGIMPANALARRFGDLLGETNQRLAEAADEVFWCVAGIPVRVK
ncbi:MAG TPA: bifunctional adenosylcobinamide kinase/adenosylcobinamide-phosphate guanylyltransferase [Gemmataceae bacterium]|nr:bifunctional adenosylcobinamide kinase/adenosylcobinamide-phosphate guanylyltransferase [Gemmataceae bacterium]